uniref:Uncharacterized protein n=1 Tax=Sphaerodactylus townsendi TaxID=933632 RepID=A0ACB8FLK1_9SAUR
MLHGLMRPPPGLHRQSEAHLPLPLWLVLGMQAHLLAHPGPPLLVLEPPQAQALLLMPPWAKPLFLQQAGAQSSYKWRLLLLLPRPGPQGGLLLLLPQRRVLFFHPPALFPLPPGLLLHARAPRLAPLTCPLNLALWQPPRDSRPWLLLPPRQLTLLFGARDPHPRALEPRPTFRHSQVLFGGRCGSGWALLLHPSTQHLFLDPRPEDLLLDPDSQAPRLWDPPLPPKSQSLIPKMKAC